MRVSPGFAVCLAGSAGVLLSIWAACKHAQPDVDAEQRAALIDAFGPLRPVEGRLAGVPFAPLRRGGPPPKPRHKEEWKRVAREVEARSSAGALANQALVRLALRDSLEDAIQLLEAATHLSHPNAQVWSDLAAAQLAQAEAAHEPHRLIAALEAADRALAIDSRLPEALFNRAKIAERLGLRSRALADWKVYLPHDDRSPWATEARTSRTSLLEPNAAERWKQALPRLEKAVKAGDSAALSRLVHDFPGRAHTYLEGTVFPAWARAVESGDTPEAARLARAARSLATLLQDLTGDRLDAEAAAAIGDVPPALALDLARAHRRYAEGGRFYDQVDYTSASPQFAAALEGFERAGSPFSLLTRSKLAACDYWLGRRQQGLAATRKLFATAKSRSYWDLIGRTGWLIGLAELEVGQADLAQEPLDEALWAFRKVHDAGSEASIDSLLANRLAYLGNRDEAWRVRLEALCTAIRAGDPRPLTTVFNAAARAVVNEGLTTEAIRFQDEVLHLAEASGDPQRIAEAHWGRATIYRQGGDLASARRFIGDAEKDGSRIPDQQAARPTLAGIAATAGEIWLETDPQRALASLTRALELYEDNAYSRTKILLNRARALLALGNDHDAESDLDAAVGEFERQRDKIQPGSLRVTYFETAQQVFEELLALKVRRGDAERAFDYAERSKARTLLDSLAARHLAPDQPLASAEVERRLPPGTVLVEYAVLKDRVVAWVRGASRGFRGAARSIAWNKADLEVEIARLAKAIVVPSGDRAADRTKFERCSGTLFTRLIAPILDQVPEGATLVVVPDGALRDVPFAALRDPHSGRFLIERNPLIVAPSATIFLAPFDQRGDRPREGWHTLAVGGAKINQRLYPEHGPLPHTEKEAGEVEAAHPGLLLVRDAATVANFLAALDRFDLIHVASHAGEALNPPRPALLFTPESGPESTGALDVDAIAARRLRRPRLAVLAACSAAGGGGLGLEGGGDLARAFVQAGVPAVVGNLWSLGDEEARVFLEAFYRSFWQGESATSALQKAQVAMIHHPEARFNRPAVWGGFRLLGTAAGQSRP